MLCCFICLRAPAAFSSFTGSRRESRQSDMKKCIHFLNTAPADPDVRAVTLPALESYADRIGADLNLISERRYPDFPPSYECFQIFEAGRKFERNLMIGMEVLAGPALPDFTANLSETNVGLCQVITPSSAYRVERDPWFQRDGRDKGPIASIIATSWMTHELWQPLPGKAADFSSVFRVAGVSSLTEYCLALNLAHYGLKISGIFPAGSQVCIVDQRSDFNQSAADFVRMKMKEWA